MKDTRQLIEDYLSRQLPDDERAAIEQRIQEDASFRKEVRVAQAAHDAIKQYASERSDRAAIQNALQQVRRRQRRQFGILAAIVIALAGVAIALLLAKQFNKPHPQQPPPAQQAPETASPKSVQAIANAYLQPYEVGALLGGQPEGPDQQFRQLVNVYRQNQCPEVEQMAPALLSAPDYATETRLMLAYCLLKQGGANEALALLEETPASAADAYAAARWYMALAYLQLEQVPKAEKLLADIAQSGGEYANQARQLLADLPAPK
jgi:anti-sigma factor RsiW